jgi:Uma2 family endonuclease
MATAVASRLRIGPADHGRVMTLEQFREAEEEQRYRYELARAVLEVSEVPNDPHGVVVCKLYRAVTRYDLKYPDVVFRFGGGKEFRFWLPGMISSRNPDLGVVLRGAPTRLARTPPAGLGRGGCLSRQHRERLRSQARGIPGLWVARILDRRPPLKQQVTVLSRHGDMWCESVFRGDQVIVSLILPGLATTVSELWIDVDAPDAHATIPYAG